MYGKLLQNMSKLSHLSAHVVNRLLCENRKYISNFFNGKKLFKKCNPPDFRFYPDKLNNKKFPHMVQSWFCVSFHCIKQCKKAKKI